MKKYILLLLLFSLCSCVVGQVEPQREKMYNSPVLCEDSDAPDCLEGAKI